MAKKNQIRPTSNTISNTPTPVADIATPQTGWWTNQRTITIVIAVLAAVLYLNTLSHKFAVDDSIVLNENAFTIKGFAGIPDLWKYDTFFGFFKEAGKDQLVAGGRYRPLTPTMFAIGWQFFGDSPFIGHFFNLFWYALTCVVLYLVLLRLLKDKPYRYAVAAAAALLFTAHPIHTEAIANIKGRDEIITLLGSLAAVLFSFKAFDLGERGKPYNYLVAIVFFLALTAKENAIMFLFVVPLMYYYFTEATMGKIIKQMLFFLVPAVLFLLIRGAVIGWVIKADVTEMMNNPYLKIIGDKYIAFSPAERLATIMYTLGKYVWLLFVPYQLTHDYYPRHITMMTFGDWQVLLSLATYLGLAYIAFKSLKTKEPIGFGIIFYIFTLAIVSNLFFPIGSNMGERFVFMPSVGFCLAVSVGGYYLLKKVNGIAIMGLLGVVLALYSFKTVTRNPVWKDNYTLFKSDIVNSPNSAKLRNALGGETIAQAQKEKDPETQLKMYDEAIVHLDKAIEIHPSYKNAYLLKGNALYYKKDYEKAIATYKRCLELAPGYKDATNNLPVAYRDLGKYYGEQKQDLPNAVRCLEESYKLRPDDAETVRLLGVAYGMGQNHAKAAEYFSKVVALQPTNAQAYFDLGTAYSSMGNTAKAQEMRKKAVELDPKLGEKK